MKNIVDAKFLKENLNNKNLVLIDCRFDLLDREYGKKSYEKEHIKGAIRIDLDTQLSTEEKEHGGRNPLPSVDELVNTFEEIGISNDSLVVIYDDGDLSGPSRLWWILKYLGHKNVYVLDGGINAFKEISDETSNETTEILNRGKLDINIDESMKVDMNYVKERLHNKNVAIIDSRDYKRYIGEIEPVYKKAGHIPGALNFFWKDVLNIDNDKFSMKNIDELKNHFKTLKDYDEVIVYCGSGVTACINSLALCEISQKHTVYPGSFSDWISYDENEIE